MCDEDKARIAELEEQVADLEYQVGSLNEEVDQLKGRVGEGEERIATVKGVLQGVGITVRDAVLDLNS